ncbi:anti-anti-sigma regulatory factor, SpoIIAA [Desulfonispora thiosulfatigenes DSM 11270]|uniref:Anti-sigma factor antagonist n=1 Tax=Desulfonispora thiosulfatigenes DSM 11270 TaxID=656914 RepID=A0A1W1VQ55_DESTI|nr:anti-sigma factor antagonist [Desulfonispora thiosulfatigenes]SMB95044.1 anti-anti-sigma regulatory factor, SpoIIAA [Desulfonispora thiosulfatigenes DSM 11270]
MIAIKIKKNSLIVKVSGELDLVVAKEFSESVDKVLQNKPIKSLILDLSMVSFIDSSGLGAILGRYKIIQQQGGKMSIFGAIPSVYRILELSGIMKIIPVLTSEEYGLERKEA